MEELPDIIEVDDKRYSVKFNGFDLPMTVSASDSTRLNLMPWTYGEHMQALKGNLRVDLSDTTLNIEGFSSFVLKRSAIPEIYHDELKELALWWSGGITDEVSENVENPENVDLGPVSVTLAPWSRGEQIDVLNHCISVEDDVESVDIVEYLDKMVQHSIDSFHSEMDLEELDSSAVSKLMKSVFHMNSPQLNLPEKRSEERSVRKRNAENTLKICSHLGWTPSQVWNAPAKEISHLLSLISLTETEPVTAPVPAQKKKTVPSGLSAFPDAVVINFESDE